MLSSKLVNDNTSPSVNSAHATLLTEIQKVFSGDITLFYYGRHKCFHDIHVNNK